MSISFYVPNFDCNGNLMTGLGWYKIVDEGNECKYQAECIFIDPETNHRVMRIDGSLLSFNEKGFCTNSSCDNYKRITSYIGKRLPEELIKLEGFVYKNIYKESILDKLGIYINQCVYENKEMADNFAAGDRLSCIKLKVTIEEVQE